MDFSLLQAHARQPYLRDITALKQKWVYYLIMTVDPILRFSWIFYAIFTHNSQHSTIVSFLVAFSEVVRRGMWTLLRVENEHCANVAQYKASRDTPLPYHLGTGAEHASDESGARETEADRTTPASAAASMTATGGQGTASIRTASTTGTAGTYREGTQTEDGGRSTVRRRYTDTGKRSILQAMAEAHKQDFQKRKPPGEVQDEQLDEEECRSDDEDDEDSDSLTEDRMRARETQSLIEE